MTTVQHGFQATMTALPGQGQALVDLLLTGLEEGNPASSDACVVYLVSRSASDPDVVHITEGWTTQEEHARRFATPEAEALVAKIGPMLAKESDYTDYVPVNGKARF